MKNSNDTMGNRTRDLLTCSALPQPTAPPRTRLISYNKSPIQNFTEYLSKNPQGNQHVKGKKTGKYTHTQAYTARPTKRLQRFQCLSTGFFRVKTITPTRVVLYYNAATCNVSSDITYELGPLAVRNNSYRAHHKRVRFKEHVMINFTSDKSGGVKSSGV